MKSVQQTPSAPQLKGQQRIIPINSTVRYLYAPGEAENDTRRRATDPIWLIKGYTIKHSTVNSGQPNLYYLNNGPQRSFVREELQIIPSDTELPPKKHVN